VAGGGVASLLLSSVFFAENPPNSDPSPNDFARSFIPESGSFGLSSGNSGSGNKLCDEIKRNIQSVQCLHQSITVKKYIQSYDSTRK
jgi:hypothetical protein